MEQEKKINLSTRKDKKWETERETVTVKLQGLLEKQKRLSDFFPLFLAGVPLMGILNVIIFRDNYVVIGISCIIVIAFILFTIDFFYLHKRKDYLLFFLVNLITFEVLGVITSVLLVIKLPTITAIKGYFVMIPIPVLIFYSRYRIIRFKLGISENAIKISKKTNYSIAIGVGALAKILFSILDRILAPILDKFTPHSFTLSDHFANLWWIADFLLQVYLEYKISEFLIYWYYAIKYDIDINRMIEDIYNQYKEDKKNGCVPKKKEKSEEEKMYFWI